jgi:hypothetical protein
MTNREDLPRNHVLAIIDGNEAAAKAALELQHAGFPETFVFHGDELSETVGAQDEKKGNFLTRALQSIPEHLSEESDFLDQYQEEAKKGGTVIAVKTEDRDRARIVGDILERHGARNARFFGGLMVTDLSATTNPSAPENVTESPISP